MDGKTRDDATLDLARLLISPESNLKDIGAFDDAAHAVACGYINQSNCIAGLEAKVMDMEKVLEQRITVYSYNTITLPDGRQVISHPTIPPHFWDGDKFTKIVTDGCHGLSGVLPTNKKEG